MSANHDDFLLLAAALDFSNDVHGLGAVVEEAGLNVELELHRDLAIEQSRAGHSVGILCDSSTGGEHEERLFQTIMPYLSLGLTRMAIDRAITPRGREAGRGVPR